MALDVNELSTMDATAQAELVRRRELTPLELVDAAIARIERVNPAINAVITPLFEDARAAAVSRDLPNGPFRGVPLLLKDLCAMQKGQPYYLGNRALRDMGFRAPLDMPLGARFRAAGFITVGKTNLPEFGMQTTTQPLAFGATHNPWDLDRSTVARLAVLVRPWRPGWCRSHMRTMAVARSGSQQRGVAWLG